MSVWVYNDKQWRHGPCSWRTTLLLKFCLRLSDLASHFHITCGNSVIINESLRLEKSLTIIESKHIKLFFSGKTRQHRCGSESKVRQHGSPYWVCWKLLQVRTSRNLGKTKLLLELQMWGICNTSNVSHKLYYWILQSFSFYVGPLLSHKLIVMVALQRKMKQTSFLGLNTIVMCLLIFLS